MTSDSPYLATYPPLPFEIERAEGCELIASDGRRYVDLYGGHCVCLLGHNPPALLGALRRQMERITFYSTALHLEERDAAARALLELAPEGFDRVFFVNSGAEATENALKLACATSGRSVVAAIEGAFHGRTAAADAVTGDAARVPHFPRTPFEVRWVAYGDADGLQRALAPGDVAAVILEPIQSMAGCRVQPPAVVEVLNRHARPSGALVVADEVQGGFGRCLEDWSHQALGLRADLLTCAKGLGAGFPVGAVLVRDEVPAPATGLFGSTFGGGPLAAAAVRTVCAAVRDPQLRLHVAAVARVLRECASLPGVLGVTGRGLLCGVRVGRPSAELRRELLGRGFVVGGSNDPAVIRLMPPLNLGLEPAQAFVAALGEALAGC